MEQFYILRSPVLCNHYLFAVSVDLTILDISLQMESYKWNHTVYGPLRLASFT